MTKAQRVDDLSKKVAGSSCADLVGVVGTLGGTAKALGRTVTGVLVLLMVLCVASCRVPATDSSGLAQEGPAMEGSERTIIEEWPDVEAPAPPELREVAADPQETALLVLDMQNRNCNRERRPRCVASIPRVRRLLDAARAAGAPVIYSLTGGGAATDIREELALRAGEPVVKSSVDKFHQTELEELLRTRGVRAVILVGTSAHGAVLHTATGAALRGFDVIVPVDGMSAGDAYAEQYTCWHLANAPGTRRRTTMTRCSMISFTGEGG